MTTPQGFQTIKISEVEPWPGINPRMSFDQDSLQELAESIRADGLLQPIAVAPAGLQKDGVKYWVFAGERRLRAVQFNVAKMNVKPRDKFEDRVTIDAIVHDVDEATAHRLAGVENLDRNDLTAIEEAIWLAREIELTGLTHKGLGETLGRSQAWVANRIRLLDLPKPIQTMIHAGTVAPAMARDTLLRFTKLDKSVRPKLWKAIAKELRRVAKKDSPVLLTALRGAVVHALREAGAIEIREGHQYAAHSNMSFRISDSDFGAFKKEHAGRCVQAVCTSWQGDEAMHTFAVKEWKELTSAATEEARSTRTTGGVSKKKLAKPKLGPAKKAVDYYKLQQEYGFDNVIAFDQIVEPAKIDPASVARTTRHDKEELVYVGPNVRALKGARTRAKTPVRAEVAEKIQSGRMDEGADLTASQVLTGLLEAVFETNFYSTLKGMIEAELGREVDLDRYSIGKAQIAALKIPAKSLKRIAAGIAHVAIGKDHYWDLDGKIDKAVESRVTRDSAKARKAWLAEHAPKGAK